MKTLIITAQPSLSGFTHQMATQYAGTLTTKGEEYEIINLYEPMYSMPFLSFENAKNIAPCAVRDSLQQKIKESKKLVFMFPMWWGEYPAIVKNFIDNIFMAGFAFRYTKGTPEGLLHEKTAEVYMTCDAPGWFYFFFGFPFKRLFSNQILRFCGIKVKQFKLFGGLSKASPEKKSKILQKITSLALL